MFIVFEVFIVLAGVLFIISRVEGLFIKSYESYYIITLFTITLIAYIYINVKLIRRLKQFYPNFYKKENKKVP